MVMDQAPPALNFDGADQGNGSFAIAPVAQNTSNVQALVQPDGKISLTIKAQQEANAAETEGASSSLQMHKQASSKTKKRKLMKSQTEKLERQDQVGNSDAV